MGVSGKGDWSRFEGELGVGLTSNGSEEVCVNSK